MGANILVIDDESCVRRVLEKMLTRVGHAVEVVGNVQEARQKIESQTFDLVLCDLHLEGATGYDLLKYARTLHPETAGILMTGDSFHEPPDESVVVGYLMKPFTTDEITSSVKAGLSATAQNRGHC